MATTLSVVLASLILALTSKSLLPIVEDITVAVDS
jgi:hypothetical protein